MKKSSKLAGIVIGCAGFLLAPLFNLVSCTDYLKPPAEITENNNQKYSSDVNLDFPIETLHSPFAKAAFLTVKAAADSIELAEKASVDIESIGRSAFAENRELNFHDLGTYIAGHSTGARNATGEAISLEDELGLIAEQYQADISALEQTPDPSLLNEMFVIEDGIISMIGGLAYPVDSLEGIATIEVLNRVAQGETIEAVTADIQAEIAQFLTIDETGERGLYLKTENAFAFNNSFTSGGRWDNGIVRYRFEDADSSFSENEIKAAKSAMAEWSSKTNNEVWFTEISPSGWDQFAKGIGQYQYVTIGKYNLDGKSGDSTVGSVATSKIRIVPRYATDKVIYMHELGHTLGLMHEHQRYDRDNYVNIESEKLGDKLYSVHLVLRLWRYCRKL